MGGAGGQPALYRILFTVPLEHLRPRRCFGLRNSICAVGQKTVLSLVCTPWISILKAVGPVLRGRGVGPCGSQAAGGVTAGSWVRPPCSPPCRAGPRTVVGGFVCRARGLRLASPGWMRIWEGLPCGEG